MELHIYNAVKNYVNIKPMRMHMPAHKGNKRFSKMFSCAKSDVTELDFIGNEQAVEYAQKDIAKILGANDCRIISNGATGGILSAMYIAKNFGSKIIVNRNSHKSVYNALALMGIEPIVIGSTENCIGNGETGFLAELENAVSSNGVIGAFLTYPDYFGNAFNIKAVSSIIKKHGKKLFIDNAHGGHYAFINGKVYAGEFADVWVDSAHKVLDSLNQGAIICVNESVSKELLDRAVSTFCTTSPSYQILGSVEYGVKFASENKGLFNDFAKRKQKLEEALKINGVKLIESDDPFKLTLNCKASLISGVLAEVQFEKQKIFAEMYAEDYVLFMFSHNTTAKQLKKLYKTIIKVWAMQNLKNTHKAQPANTVPKLRLTYLQAINSATKQVVLSESEGMVCGENTGVFPPCYPIILAGEVIDEKVIKILSSAKCTFGITDGKIKVIK